jgi:type I restriction enzyme S subunit
MQRRIAEILSTLDETIEQTEALIAKKQQVKAGLMLDLFSRGVTPDGRLRPTREQAPEFYKESALGWIPWEWEVCSWGQLTESWAMGPRFSAEAYSENGNVATMRTTDMNDDGLVSYSTMPRARIDLTGLAHHLLQPSDFIISRSGTCGICAVFEGFEIPVLPGAFLIRFRFLPKMSPYFMRYYINSRIGAPAVARIAEGGVQKNIRGTGLCRLLLPVPSMYEQKKILERLSTIDRTADVETAQLAKLKQLKHGLIHDLLTGHVRVPSENRQ